MQRCRPRFVAQIPAPLLCAALLLVASTAFAAPMEKKKGGGDSFIQFPTLTATIFHPDGGRGVLTVDLGIDVADGGLRQKASASIPILRDAYTRALLRYAPSIPPGAPPDVEAIARQLQQATDQALGRPGAKLLLGSVLEN